MHNKFEIRSRILCEEVRQEKNNKYILLGVFSGDIFVESLPADVPLALYFDGKVASKEMGDFYIRLSGPGEGKAIMSVKYKPSDEATNVAIVTPRVEVNLEKEGILKVETSDDQEHWTLQLERTVKIGKDLWTLVPHKGSTPKAHS
jgi:hypothetical protein